MMIYEYICILSINYKYYDCISDLNKVMAILWMLNIANSTIVS
jgi:hypothetical protein